MAARNTDTVPSGATASDARARTFVRILVAVGVSGLSGEVALVAFVLRTGAWGTTTPDRHGKRVGENDFQASRFLGVETTSAASSPCTARFDQHHEEEQ